MIVTARKLAHASPGKPRQADLRRAISTAYYALFHHACIQFSAIVLRPGSGTYLRAWSQAYRYLDHGPARQRCIEACRKERNFSAGIVVFAEAFIDLQQRRNAADYDPIPVFTVVDANALIVSAEAALAAFDVEPVEAQRAFVVFLALRPKNR